MVSSRRGAALAALATFLALPSPARADTASDHDAAVAEFNAGRSLFEGGDCARAVPHFIASLAREQSVGARFNLADCTAREGRTSEAWNHYKAAEQLAIKKNDAKRAELAHAAAAGLDQKVVKLRLALPSDPPVKVLIDGTAVDPTDLGLLATGYAVEASKPHAIRVEAADGRKWKKEGVAGEPGVELPAIGVELPTAENAMPVPPPPAPSTSPLRVASYVVGGVGIAALATGGVFGLLASSAKSDAESACTSGGGFTYPGNCNPARKGDVDPANDRAKTDATIATIGVAAGGVLVAGAAVMFFASRPSRSTAIIAPVVLTGGGGAALAGTF